MPLALETLESQFAWSNQMNFGCALGDQLENPKIGTSKGATVVTGVLRMEEEVEAACEWRFESDWMTYAPRAACRDFWVKTGPAKYQGALHEWHVLKNHGLCYVLNTQWADFLKKISPKLSSEDLILCAAGYATNNLRWLLTHHLEGFRLGLTRWPKAWPQWPHYEAGEVAYARARPALVGAISMEDLS